MNNIGKINNIGIKLGILIDENGREKAYYHTLHRTNTSSDYFGIHPRIVLTFQEFIPK
jgi:hypothetical protein